MWSSTCHHEFGLQTFRGWQSGSLRAGQGGKERVRWPHVKWHAHLKQEAVARMGQERRECCVTRCARCLTLGMTRSQMASSRHRITSHRLMISSASTGVRAIGK